MQINMYYEKIYEYLFPWLLLLALAIVTLWSIARQAWLLLPAQRRAYVHRLLRDVRLNCYATCRDPNPVHNEWAAHISENVLKVCVSGVKCSHSESRAELSNVLSSDSLAIHVSPFVHSRAD